MACALVLLLATTILLPTAAQTGLYQNPVLDMDFPDPSVTRAPDSTFYAYATMGNGHHLQVASSADLVHWTYLGEAMPAPAAWTNSDCFWAPDVQYHADAGLYDMYYAASTVNNAGVCTAMCIGVATSADPRGPFVDAAPAPLVCSDAFAAIDPKSFDDTAPGGSGSTFLYWGSGGAPIMARELASNRTAWAPGSVAVPVLLPNASRAYESLVEGAWLHAHAGTYYLLTSGDACCGGGAHYAVIASSAPHALGPFTRRGDADGTGRDVMLAQAGDGSRIAAPGHNCIVTDDAGNDWLLYHGYVGGNLNGPRALQLDLLLWTTPNGTHSPIGVWPAVAGGVPSTTPQAVPYVRGSTPRRRGLM